MSINLANTHPLALHRRRLTTLSQAQLAARLGVTQNEVSRWERGKVAPSRESLAALAKVFGTTAGRLLDEIAEWEGA